MGGRVTLIDAQTGGHHNDCRREGIRALQSPLLAAESHGLPVVTREQEFDPVEALLRTYPKEVSSAGPKPESLVSRAEAFLGVTFPPSYRDFLRRWGALGFGPEEIYGITSELFETGRVPNGIWFTAKERAESGLPPAFVVVVNVDGDQYYCIDTARECPNHECAVVIWDVPTRTVVGTKSDSFGQLLLDRLRETAEIIDALRPPG